MSDTDRDVFPGLTFSRRDEAVPASEAGQRIRELHGQGLGLFAHALLYVARMGEGQDVITFESVMESSGGTPGDMARSIITSDDLFPVPDRCVFDDPSYAMMSCRDVASLLLAVDRESHDPGMNSFMAVKDLNSVSTLNMAPPLRQICNVSDALEFMSDHALPDVKVPVVPLLAAAYDMLSGSSRSLTFIRNKFGRTNFSFDESGKPILTDRERQSIALSNDVVVDRLSAYYACFDQRFEAIFYPTTQRELAMLSCAVKTSVASAVWQEAAVNGLPESQDDEWLAGAVAGRDDLSFLAHMTSKGAMSHILDARGGSSRTGSKVQSSSSSPDEALEELMRKAGLATIQPGHPGSPAFREMDGVASVRMSVPVDAIDYDEWEGDSVSCARSVHLLLSSCDASPYPAMTPPALDPTRSAAALVLGLLTQAAALPTPLRVLCGFIDSREVAEDVKSRLDGVPSAAELWGEVSRLAHQSQSGGRLLSAATADMGHDRTKSVTKDAHLQYVLSRFVDEPVPRGASMPLSFRQLSALARGYKPDQVKQAIANDFELELGRGGDIQPLLATVIDGLDPRSVERELSIYGDADVDPIRFTLAAMAMPERLGSADQTAPIHLTPQHLMAMLIEMPSAFSDAYGHVSGSRQLAAYAKSNGRNISSDIKVYQPYFMLHDDARFGSRIIDPTQHDRADEILADRVFPGLAEGAWDVVLRDGDRYFDSYRTGDNWTYRFEAELTDAFAIEFGASGDSIGTSGHVRSMLAVRDSLPQAIREHPEAVVAVRTGGRYEIHPSVIRLADVICRHAMGTFPDDDRDAATVRYRRAFLSSLMIHLLVDACELPDVVPTSYGTMFEALYPRSWEGCESWMKDTDDRPGATSPGTAARGGAGRILSRSAGLGHLLDCSVDMTAAADGAGESIVERDRELQEVISVLMRREKSNVMILGEAGTGKTALVELLASAIARGDVPERLRSKSLLQLDVMTLSAYSEASVAELFDDAKGKDVILFMDEIHALQPRTLNALKPYLARADISLIGATTNAEYQATILKDKALARRFSTIRLHELNQEQTVTCIKSRMKEYEQWYGVAYDTKTPYAIATAAATYMTNRHSPDRELDVMDVAGAIASMASRTVVLEDDAYAAVRQLTGNLSVMSMTDVLERSRDSQGGTDRVEQAFGDIVSQDDAKRVVAESLSLSQIGLKSGSSPKNVLMFVGPSGVGKTMMAERIPKFLGTSHDAVLSINLSEYIGRHEYSRLVGSPPGYVGFEQGGLLTNFGMAHPDGVVIFDEIEKASSTTRQMLLKLFDQGYIESAAGERVDCRSMTFVCTSNAGFAHAGTKRIGFEGGADRRSYDEKVAAVKDELIRALSAPFVGRFDEIVVFEKLDIDDILQSCRNEYASLVERYQKSRGIDVKEFFGDDDLDAILSSISEREVAEIGARSIMRRVDRAVERAIAGGRSQNAPA